ncbi:LysM peptidoglycan-binding domain-containing M23 family metallopeptidase [Fodinicurvata fenggangensis]|uniref:LysM peptidoglycan-binding domain-containing M23 family metallopeptidase n=1 Tax=Fodinicurvata fenggangensis TaxID=1121830 RepID=UPI00068A01EC|nr:M23 family metallopeptidase [Fodinicurvata fenggangensis]
MQEGDTLFSISNDTQTRLTELVDLNELEPPYELSPGERLRLPERSRQTESQQQAPLQQEDTQVQEPASDMASVEPAAATGAGTEPGESEEERTETKAPDMSQPESSDIPVAAETGPISDPPALTGQGFSWPLQGEILSRYGAQGDGQHNDGINIAVSEGTVVRASENGVVAYAGNELRGFGNLLLVRHQDGWVTAYGHNSRLLVGRGAEVERGQPIAEAGNSGSVSRPQLHFEIRKGTRAMDPLELLEE